MLLSVPHPFCTHALHLRYLQTAGYGTFTELARTDVEVGLLSLTAAWISNLIRGTEEMSGKFGKAKVKSGRKVLSQVTPSLTQTGRYFLC